MDEDDHAPPPPPKSGLDLPNRSLESSQATGWAAREGKSLFWMLLFAPAILCLTTLAIGVKTNASGPELLILAGIVAYGICVYCGIWLASGWNFPKMARIGIGIALSLGFAVLNAMVFFGGCFVVLMSMENFQ